MASESSGAPAEVSVVEPTGAETLVFSRIAGKEITAVFRERHQFAPGQQIHLAPDLERRSPVRQGERPAHLRHRRSWMHRRRR